MNGPACACSSVRYLPVDLDGGRFKERWVCVHCETVFVKQVVWAKLEDFVPSADSVNALPTGIRKYVHDLETRCDPAGDIQRMAQLRQENELLRLSLEDAAKLAYDQAKEILTLRKKVRDWQRTATVGTR